jgi:hypothetical protein
MKDTYEIFQIRNLMICGFWCTFRVAIRRVIAVATRCDRLGWVLVITTTEAIFDLRRTVWFYGAGQEGLVLDIAMMQPLWAIALSVDVSLK